MIQLAKDPDDLARFFVERANAGDVDGLVALYESNAILVRRDGTTAVGAAQIRAYYAAMLARGLSFTPGEQSPALRNGDIALTSTRLVNGTITAEIARRQPDGSWRWIIDQPAISRQP